MIARAASSRSAARLFWVALAFGSAAGCDVTPEKIQTWKQSERGPAKLRDALKNDSVSAALRAQTLVALVELGMTKDVEEDLIGRSEPQRRAVIHAAVPLLVTMALGSGKGSAVESTRLEREGKDALYRLREPAQPEDRALIDDALIAWTTVDLVARATAGAYSGEQVLSAVGPRAGPRLVKIIGAAATSEVNRSEAARLLGKLGDLTAREEAGAVLVERARREKVLAETTVQQLGYIGGDHAVAYLTSVAGDAERATSLRHGAVVALAQTGDAASLPTALRLVWDRKAPPAIRDAAFDLASRIGPTAVPGLSKLLADKEDMVRWRTADAMLAAGKVDAIPTVLEGLPTRRAYPRDDLRAFLVHQLAMLGPASLPMLKASLGSKSWIARLSAAEAIAEVGQAEDAASLDALSSDSTRLPGWPGKGTLGDEARALAASLRQKKPPEKQPGK